MGTDAKMFAKQSKQYFYFDRLYNIPEREDYTVEWMTDDCGITRCGDPMRMSGISVSDMILYVIDLISDKIEVMGHPINKPILIDVVEWLNTLPKDDIVFIRDEGQDEYFKLCNRHGGNYKEAFI